MTTAEAAAALAAANYAYSVATYVPGTSAATIYAAQVAVVAARAAYEAVVASSR